jgi:general secretion pathway protein A
MSSAAYLPDPDTEGDSALATDPFRNDAGTAFYFDEAVRVKRLNLLFHLVPYSDVLLVTGEAGSGKSCVLRRLLASAPGSWRVCCLQATATLDDAQLVEMLQKEFSLRPDDGPGDNDQRLRLLRESLYGLRHTALIPVLAVDDAHLLTPAALALLADLTEPWQGKDKLLSVVLFAEPGINKKLIAPGLETLRARITHTFDIPPLSEEDTGRYIRHRLSAAGLDQKETPFTHSVIKFIHVASRGLPGRINEFARVVLQNSAQRTEGFAPSPSNRRGWVYVKYSSAALLVSAVVVGLLYQDRLSELVSSSKPGTAAHPAAEAPATAQSPALAEEGKQSETVIGPAAPEAPAPAEPGPGGATAEDTMASLPAPEPISPTPLPAAAAPASPEAAAAPHAPAAVTGPANDVSPPPQASAETAPAPGQPEAPAGGDGAPPAGNQAAVAAEPASAPVADATESPRDDAWLLAQDPASYTLQLLVASRAQCLAYIERYGLGDGAAIFQTRSGGQTYFALVYGVYGTDVDAADAGKALSEQDVKMSPWVRRMSVIQARIHEFQAVPKPAGPVASKESVTAHNNKGVTIPNGPRREAWLLEQPPETYTLQLFTGREANVLDYLKRHALMDKVALFHPADSSARPTVVYGSSPSGPQAMQAAKELAAQLPDIKPWARPLREIQTLISPQVPADTPPP